MPLYSPSFELKSQISVYIVNKMTNTKLQSVPILELVSTSLSIYLLAL